MLFVVLFVVFVLVVTTVWVELCGDFKCLIVW